MSQFKSIKDLSRGDGAVTHVEAASQPPLPPPFDNPENILAFDGLTDKADHFLADGHCNTRGNALIAETALPIVSNVLESSTP